MSGALVMQRDERLSGHIIRGMLDHFFIGDQARKLSMLLEVITRHLNVVNTKSNMRRPIRDLRTSTVLALNSIAIARDIGSVVKVEAWGTLATLCISVKSDLKNA